jgi:ABC-type dipeptide/oligopeptide/nickel transport system permease subunit
VRLKRLKLEILFSFLVTLIFLSLALIPWQLWFSPDIELRSMNLSPSSAHFLGTDNLGRDLLVRLSKAIGGAVLPIWISVTLATVLGSVVGVLMCALQVQNGYRRFAGYLLGLPGFIAAIPIGLLVFYIAAWNEKAGLWPVIIGLTLVVTSRSSSQVLELFAQDSRLGFWQAHAASGGRLLHRLWNYGILGSWRELLLATFCFHLSVAVSIEASLSYLGFGVEEPLASFGNMLASHFDLIFKSQWQVAIFVAGAMAIVIATPFSLMSLFGALLWRKK